MPGKEYPVAKLDDARLEKLQALEKQLQMTLVAVDRPRLAKLSAEQLEVLQKAERELETTLLAYASSELP